MATLDLAEKRAERTASRASQDSAGREARGEILEITIGEQVIATLGAEFPLDALKPLREVDDEIGLLLSRAMSMAAKRGGDENQNPLDAAQMIVDVLAVSQNLPTKLIDVVTGIGESLLGKPGLDAFLAIRPSVQDIGALVGAILEFYGMAPGESSGSSESQTSDGATSKPTLPAATPEPMPETPSEQPETLAS